MSRFYLLKALHIVESHASVPFETLMWITLRVCPDTLLPELRGTCSEGLRLSLFAFAATWAQASEVYF